MSEIDLQKPLSVYKASAGTGKTFTLAAYYVGLLLSGESYRNILAVTFTNKATEEMKVRIMGYLYDIAQNNPNAKDFYAKAKDYMLPKCPNLKKSDEELRSIAQNCFTEMLADYDNVHVSTIDSFLQTLLSGMAQLLNQRIGFAPELDTKKLFTEVVDRLISENMEGNTADIVSDYISSRMDEEKNWDIRENLIKTAGILYSEKAQIYAAAGQIEMDPTAIKKYREEIANWRKKPEFVKLKELCDAIETQINALPGKAPNKDHAKAALDLAIKSLYNPKEIENDKIFRGFTPTQTEKLQGGEWDKNLGAPLCQELVAFQKLCSDCRGLYFESQLTIKYLNDMRLMQALVDGINETLHEQNKVLLAETSSILRNALKPGDADFILEKVGIRYRHIMIDEFQDTSKLQWEVFRPLLEEILSSTNQTVLIVGDIKQSIYRWRNGDWHIMADLSKDTKIGHYYNEKPLKRNFRSQKEVVKFNLEAMQSAANDPAAKGVDAKLYDEGYEEQKIGDYYNNKHSEGYVRLRVYPVPTKKEKIIKKLIIADMFRTMEELLVKGIRPADIMILIRKNKEAMDIARYFQENILTDEATYPQLNTTRLISRDSFVLKQSQSVCAIINALRYIDSQSLVAGHYIKLVSKEPNICTKLDEIDKSLPLYEMVQKVVELLFSKNNKEDIAYVNCLLDNVRTYVSENGSNRTNFLQYWDDFLCNKAIPAAQADAIQIMTVHSAKGLESKTLFIPFCSWPLTEDKGQIWCKRAKDPNGDKYIPIEIKKDAIGTEYEDAYNDECKEQEVDNLNLLYVALTRAADNLYVYVNEKVTKNGLDQNNVGYLLINKAKLSKEVLGKFNDGKDDPENIGYAEWEIGELTFPENKEVTQSTFGFEQAKGITATLQSDSSRVRFRQSKEGAMHASTGGKAEMGNQRQEIGTICHDLLSRIKTQADVKRVMDTAYSKGVFANPEQHYQAEEYINKIWQDQKMAKWFDGTWELLCEQGILINGEECRPDRVMIRGNEVVVLDYKFGAKQTEHIKQVKNYIAALQALGYQNVKGYLWYAQTGEMEEVK